MHGVVFKDDPQISMYKAEGLICANCVKFSPSRNVHIFSVLTLILYIDTLLLNIQPTTQPGKEHTNTTDDIMFNKTQNLVEINEDSSL